MGKIKKCRDCKYYSLEDRCGNCGGRTEKPEPPKFSPEDRHGKYRRKVKNNNRADKNG
ncbi:MAG: RNA-protein complex protein Nop10 [Candidatus Nanohaloarchaea archaeon]|nr:RNA-protein complex protein Nop10 [Candidatus Nanohaloarchaea archaeon]